MFEIIDWWRIALVFISQLFIIVCFLIISIKVLKRNKSSISIIFSSAYLTYVIAFIINIMYFFIRENPTTYILHVFATFLTLFGLFFHPLFNLNLLKIHYQFKFKSQFMLLIISGIILFFLLITPSAVIINENTGWRPLWHINLAIGIYIILTSVVYIPTIIIAIIIYKRFQDDTLKKKWKFYIIGFCGYASIFYGSVYYNTTNDQVFKQIWGLLSLLVIPFGFLIYYGLGRQIPSYFPKLAWKIPSFTKERILNKFNRLSPGFIKNS